MKKDTNTGLENSGDWNSGNWNSGDRNSGDWNSGYRNSGDSNSGYWNSGARNSGYWNSGYRNSGNWNSGTRNSGDRNSGDWNSGLYNSTSFSSGLFNNIQAKILIFNKPSTLTMEEFFETKAYSLLCNMELTTWISESDMTNEEKIANPQFHVIGGYLKKFEYKEACQNMWKKFSEEDKKEIMSIQNFDAEVFLDITGIDVREKTKPSCDGKEVEIDGIKYKLTEIKN